MTNKAEFGQNILQGWVYSHQLYVWFFVNLDDIFLSWFAQVFMKMLVCTRYILGFKISNDYFIRFFYTI
jgi:hypothetical protein